MNLKHLGLVCSLAMAAWSSAAAAAPFTMTSTSFKDGQVLDKKYTGNLSNNPNCVGENITPQLSWSNVPTGTKSFAIIVIDPEGRAPAGVVHWLAYGIPASVTSFAEGEAGAHPDKYVGGKNVTGRDTYLGPCIPAGIGNHHYTFIVIATDLEPGALQPGMSRDELTSALTGHVKGSAGIVGLFGRP